MIRQRQFERLLVEWAGNMVGRPLVWGETDCWSLVRGAVLVMTRTALAGAPSITSTEAAQQELQALSVRYPEDTCGRFLLELGFEGPHEPSWAQPGDVGLRGTMEFGVVVGRDYLYAVHDRGVVLEGMQSMDMQGTRMYRLK